jgi:uncharacterized protein
LVASNLYKNKQFLKKLDIYRKFLINFCSAFFVFGFILVKQASAALSLPNPTREFYVNDFANILSAETKQYVYDISLELFKQTKAQLVVVTASSLNQKDIREYNLELSRKWGVGDKTLQNGLVVLLAPNERQVDVCVGTGLEGKINDAKAGRLLDEYAVNEFKNKNWNEGIKSLASVFVNEIYKEYGQTSPGEIKKNIKKTTHKTEVLFSRAFVVIVILLFFIFRRRIFFLSRGSGISFFGNGSGDGGNFGGGGGFSGGGASRKF